MEDDVLVRGEGVDVGLRQVGGGQGQTNDGGGLALRGHSGGCKEGKGVLLRGFIAEDLVGFVVDCGHEG